MVEDSIVFLAAAERGYPRKLVFSYLAEVHRAFADQLQTEFGPTWRQQVGTIAKPYAFLKFGELQMALLLISWDLMHRPC